ncbi:MAG: hypothetical protein VW258_04480 [Thalassolituus sp.]
MAENTDILLGYFDSLLASGGLTVAEDTPIAKALEAIPEASDDPLEVVTEACVKLCDTVPLGYRMIPLYSPQLHANAANNLITAFELLSLSANLTHGKVREHILKVCRGVLNV